MKRTVMEELMKWKDDSRKKPLLIRGARQVGKTYTIRQLGDAFEDFQELNFELKPEAKKAFISDLDPQRIIRDLSIFTGKRITPGKTLLFFDEIQEAPNAIKAIRYFYEMMPQLHVIAAGSLLDFELENIGMPVGRVSSIYMHPMSFKEFLTAKGEDLLIEVLDGHNITENISDMAHRKLLKLLGEYMTVGGMPEAVGYFVETSELNQCFKIHRSIIDTYRQDFNKYAKKFQLKYVELLFSSIPALVGKKFKYSHVPGEYRKRELMPSLDLLVKAGIVNRITNTGGQGVPLAVAAKPERFKMIFLDIALCQTILGSDLGSWLLEPEINFVNKGELTEALIGQELLACSPPDRKSELYYWQREAKSSNAELDYLVQQKGKVIPVEVKSGATGTLKSMRYFLETYKQSPYGIRFSTSNFTLEGGIHNYPLYAVGKLFKGA